MRDEDDTRMFIKRQSLVLANLMHSQSLTLPLSHSISSSSYNQCINKKQAKKAMWSHMTINHVKRLLDTHMNWDVGKYISRLGYGYG